MMSAALPDKPAPIVSVAVPENKPEPTEIPDKTSVDTAEPKSKGRLPIHVMQQTWNAQKRLKKVQVATLERVYRRTKRPTVSSLSFSMLQTCTV